MCHLTGLGKPFYNLVFISSRAMNCPVVQNTFSTIMLSGKTNTHPFLAVVPHIPLSGLGL